MSPDEDKKGRINKLQEDLYSRKTAEITRKERPTLSPSNADSRGGWTSDEELAKELSMGAPEEKKGSFFSKLFLVSLAFFAVAAVIAGFIFFSGQNVISSKNVDILVSGLVAVSAGQELSLDVTVQNNNNVALNDPELFIEYPEGTRKPEDINVDLTRDSIKLDTIPSGGNATKTIKAVFFGEKDSVKQIKIVIDYKPSGSNARFSKEKTYDISISSAPIIVNVDMPKEINAGQEFSMTVGVTSNSTVSIRDLLLQVDYPFGFTPNDTNPKVSYGNNVWLIGDIDPKEKRTVIVKGKIEGQDEEERTFRFTAGTVNPNDAQKIGVAFTGSQSSLTIKKPFIATKLELDYSDGKQSIVPIDTRVQGVISWANNLLDDLTDVIVQVKFSGQAADRNRITALGGGFYRSTDNTIIWEKNTTPALSLISPSETGSLGFSLYTIPLSNALSLQSKNMEILAEVTITGNRNSSEDSQRKVVSTVSQKIKIATNLSLNSRLLYSTGSFKNSGPIPPKAEQRTSYTVAWTLSNTFNDVGGAVASATLPPYVSWVGAVLPASEKVTFDENTRTIVWQVGDVKAGAGVTASTKQVSFQVNFEPSLSQVGTVPNILENIRVVGGDRFTEKGIDFSLSPLTTKISTDPSYDFGDEQVVR